MGEIIAAAVPQTTALLTASGTKLKPQELDLVLGYLQREGSKNTRRAYQAHWCAFKLYCEDHETVPISCSPEIVAGFLAGLADAGRAASTVVQARAAIHKAHELLKMRQKDPSTIPDPTTHPIIKALMKSIGEDASADITQKMALNVTQVRAMMTALGDDIRGVRDRAMISLGLLSAMRRSEIVSLRVDQIAFEEHDMVITLGRTKTDQKGEGAVIAVPRGSSPDFCPIELTQRWLQESGITEGAVFRGIHPKGRLLDEGISASWFVKRMKEAAKDAGLPVERIAGHSLRAGFVTEAAKKGASILDVARQTRHRDLDMVRKYYRPQEARENPASRKIGL